MSIYFKGIPIHLPLTRGMLWEMPPFTNVIGCCVCTWLFVLGRGAGDVGTAFEYARVLPVILVSTSRPSYAQKWLISSSLKITYENDYGTRKFALRFIIFVFCQRYRCNKSLFVLGNKIYLKDSLINVFVNFHFNSKISRLLAININSTKIVKHR